LGWAIDSRTMFSSLAPSLEGAGSVWCLKWPSVGSRLKYHSVPVLSSVRSSRLRRLAVPRAQLEVVQTLDSTKDHSNGNGAGTNGVSSDARHSLVSKYGEVTDLVDAASKFRAFLLEGGGHLPPGSLPDAHLMLFMDFYNNYQSM
jgi:hypothetical protein